MTPAGPSTAPMCRSLVKRRRWTTTSRRPRSSPLRNRDSLPRSLRASWAELLEWSLIIIGVLIAVTLELCGVSALPVAVGMYLSLGSTTPIFIGGALRWIADRVRGKPKSEAESETSPGVLSGKRSHCWRDLCGLVIAFFAFLPDKFNDTINVGLHLFGQVDDKGESVWKPDENNGAKIASVIMFGLLGAFLLWIGSRKTRRPPIGAGRRPKTGHMNRARWRADGGE